MPGRIPEYNNALPGDLKLSLFRYVADEKDEGGLGRIGSKDTLLVSEANTGS